MSDGKTGNQDNLRFRLLELLLINCHLLIIDPSEDTAVRLFFPSTSAKSSQSLASDMSVRKDEEIRKEIYGQLFRNHILHAIDQRCDRNHKIDVENALRLISRNKTSTTPDDVLFNKIEHILQNARLTINFDLSKIDLTTKHAKKGELVNCFAFNQKAGEVDGYNIGRAHLEESVLDLTPLFETSAYAKYGRFAEKDGNQANKSRDFQWTSRPCYGALDILDGPYGGAPTYGKSFLVLNDYMKHVSSYSPVDTFSSPSYFKSTVSPEMLSTFSHFGALIANCQNDFFGYNCLKSLIRKAEGKTVTPHPNYGKGGQHNYIDVQIYARIHLARDVKEIHISNEELDALDMQERTQTLQSIEEINDVNVQRHGTPLIFVHRFTAT